MLTAVEHAVDATLISRYTYANNEVGHRTSVVNQGSAFADMGDAMNLYGYNTRGEVTNAVRRWGNNPGSPGDPVAGQTFGYDYDPIGNRTWSKRGDYAREYDANELNQMTSRGVPGLAHLLGSADESATVTVNGQSVTRQDAYWYKDLAVTNDTAPQYPEVVIDATWSNILSSVTGNVFVAETPEDFGYDLDGNMTNDGRFAYTWDGENRLIAVETLTNVVAASGAPQVRVEYAYDHMSRRIGKTVLNAYTNSAYATTNQTVYLYDGWNLIAETILNQQSQITNLYVWGLDLSGSLQGAGGIGGLLAATFGGTTSVSSVFCVADANGNIGQLLDAANPTNILAHYEYSPFGETLVAVGDLAKANPFRFSTKYHEDESGLVYYGYRYYSPEIGRWVNRDPIEELGFVLLSGQDENLDENSTQIYMYVLNNPLSNVDPRGLLTWSVTLVYPRTGLANEQTLAPRIDYAVNLLQKFGVALTYSYRQVNNRERRGWWDIGGIGMKHVASGIDGGRRSINYLADNLNITNPVLFPDTWGYPPGIGYAFNNGVIVLLMSQLPLTNTQRNQILVHELLAHYFSGYTHNSANSQEWQGWERHITHQDVGQWKEKISCNVAEWIRQRGGSPNPEYIQP